MKRWFVLTFVMAALGAAVGDKVLNARRGAANRQAFYDLVQYVHQYGEAGEHLPQLLVFFGLPASNPTFRGVAVKGAAGNLRTFTVRQRDGGYDVFLGDAYPDREYHLLTNELGEFIRASLMEEKPLRLLGAEARFAREQAIWLEWWTARREFDGR